eukprot:3996571-Amphidinium_carterae.3
MLTDKFKEIIAAGDQQKLKQHLDKESQRLDMQPKGQVLDAKPSQQEPAKEQETRKAAKGKGGKSQGKEAPSKTIKKVALPEGAFKVAGAALPVRKYQRLRDSRFSQTSAKGKKPDELPEPKLEGVELLITEEGRTRTAHLSIYAWHLAGPKAKVSREAKILDMGQNSTLEQLKHAREPDGSVTLQDPLTKENVNYVLFPEP